MPRLAIAMYVATVTGRGMLDLPLELRKRYRVRPGDKVELRPMRGGILLERIPTLEEGFGAYPRIGRGIALQLLEEKRAELAREERSLRGPGRSSTRSDGAARKAS